MAARLGPESFSSVRDHMSVSAAGLGSILRDQKILPGTNRASMLLGLAPPSSPVELPFYDSDTSGEDPDELKEEDVWAAESRSWSKPDDMHQLPGLENLVLSKGDLAFGREDAVFGVPRMSIVEAARPARRRNALDKGPGLADAFTTNAGAVGLSRLSEISPGHKKMTPTASWTIPQLARGANESSRRQIERQSAPVKVPDWSKILGESDTKLKKMGFFDFENRDEEDERLPPHELLAKESARSDRTTFSVCEGQGRTLKGRDLSRVRNAVWNQIGFAD